MPRAQKRTRHLQQEFTVKLLVRHDANRRGPGLIEKHQIRIFLPVASTLQENELPHDNLILRDSTPA
jgi:hypothetical protein